MLIGIRKTFGKKNYILDICGKKLENNYLVKKDYE